MNWFSVLFWRLLRGEIMPLEGRIQTFTYASQYSTLPGAKEMAISV
jgi:hypothetical protein